MEELRLNRYLAQCGVTSRRGADQMIEEGVVKINGRTVYELGRRIDPKVDKVLVNGKPIRLDSQAVYVMFYKPKQVLTSLSDPQHRPTVGDFFERFPFRVFPVGRLDWDSEGLLLLTNDGEFSNQIMHPSEHIPKTYIVKVEGRPSQGQLDKLKRGVSTEVGRVKARSVEIIQRGDTKHTWLKITISEGRNRQVRRMFEKIGCDVLKLKRIAIGKLTMGSMKRGEFRVITKETALRALETDREHTPHTGIQRKVDRKHSSVRS